MLVPARVLNAKHWKACSLTWRLSALRKLFGAAQVVDKCAPYWPHSVGSILPQGNLLVTLDSEARSLALMQHPRQPL